MLAFRELITTETPSTLMVLLHGYGSNADDLISLAPDFIESLPSCNFISPNAPHEFEIRGFGGYQWYSLQDRSESAKLQGALDASPILIDFLEQQLSRFNLDYENLILAGFSQGGMMTLHTAIRLKKKIKGAICFSGYLCDLKNLSNTITSKPPILITHGDEDNVVPLDEGRKAYNALKTNDVDVTMHISSRLGHGIDNECIKATKAFLKSI